MVEHPPRINWIAIGEYDTKNMIQDLPVRDIFLYRLLFKRNMRCEEFVRDHLPSVKSCIVNVLYKEFGLTQVEISNALDITQPAVSQYLSGVRGCDTLSEEILKESREIAHEIHALLKKEALDQGKLDELFCRICKKI